MKRNYLIFGLVFLLIAVTGLSFAYWDTLMDTKSNTVVIGEGATVTATENVNSETYQLVPNGVMMGSGDVTSRTFTYNVVMSKVPANPYNLEVDVTAVTNETAADVSNLFNFTINGVTNGLATYVDAYTAVDTSETVTIEVSLVADGELVDFTPIKGQNVSFTISFKAVLK
jgi:hypothetical protein